MAFTGIATQKVVSDRKVRITGLSLASGASGTISLHGGAGAVKLPDDFEPAPYGNVSREDSVEVTFVPVTTVTTAIPIKVVKTGAGPDSFLITLTNTHDSLATPELEIYVAFH